MEAEIRNKSQAGGDGGNYSKTFFLTSTDRTAFSPAPSISASQKEEFDRLLKELEETKTKLQATEESKKAFEKEVLSLNEKLLELKNDLDMKTSGAQASEECMKDEMSYLEKRIQELELEAGENAKIIESQKVDMAKVEASKNNEIAIST